MSAIDEVAPVLDILLQLKKVIGSYSIDLDNGGRNTSMTFKKSSKIGRNGRSTRS